MIDLIDNNINLYRPEKEYYLKSLDYAKNMKNNNNNALIFHCFWRVPREFGRKQAAVLKSIIVNHKDYLKNLQINLWSNIDLSSNALLLDIKKFIKFRNWDVSNEIKGTILENIQNKSIYDDLCYLEGDLFRLLILHKYGGFYIDMDVLILRDMTPLNDFEFLYQWGTSGVNINEPNMRMNGAIMRLNKISDLSNEMLELLTKITPNINSFDWGSNLYSKITKNKILVLPGIWFDSEWGFEMTIHNPFNKNDNIELFDGAYTWHWHNQWDADIHEESKFSLIEKKHQIEFKNIDNV
jgi:hypothetical protein